MLDMRVWHCKVELSPKCTNCSKDYEGSTFCFLSYYYHAYSLESPASTLMRFRKILSKLTMN